MAKQKNPVDDIELPTAEDAPQVSPASPDGPQDEADSPGSPVAVQPAAQSLPLFRVSANGFDSRSFHAVDESDAARQFYNAHGVKDREKHSHRVERVS